jgi:SAM-dependent methyltransferase
MAARSRRALAALRGVDRAVFGRARQQYPLLLSSLSSPTSSVLDVGCGTEAVFRKYVTDVTYSVGVDVHLPRDEISRGHHTHDDYVMADIRCLDKVFKPESFETVVALDVIEHLSRDDGFVLLSAMESIAVRRVVVFTPNGFLPQMGTAQNPHQEHLSGWHVDDFEDRGYRVLGLHGYRPLRGAYAGIRFRPQALWERVALMTQPLVRSHPEHAFQLLCIKDIEDRSLPSEPTRSLSRRG